MIMATLSAAQFSNTVQMAWYLFAASFIYFAVFSAILTYHWIRFGIGALTGPGALLVYFSGSGVLLLISFLSVLSYTNAL